MGIILTEGLYGSEDGGVGGGGGCDDMGIILIWGRNSSECWPKLGSGFRVGLGEGGGRGRCKTQFSMA